jgi:hypothetical protein
LHAVESLLLQALPHRLQALAWPASAAVPHWQSKERVLLANAPRRYVPSMRQKLDLDAIYQDALAGMPSSIGGQPPLPVPAACPATPDTLLAP